MRLSLGSLRQRGRDGSRIRLGTIGSPTSPVSVSSNQYVVQQGREPGVRPGRNPSGPIVGNRSAPLPADDNQWVTHEILPGVQLRVRPGTEVAVQEISPDNETPLFLLTPGPVIGRRQTSEGIRPEYDQAGIFPLLALFAKPISKAVKKAKARREAPEEDEEGLAVGDRVNVNGIACTVQGFDSTGAVLTDSDGKRVVI